MRVGRHYRTACAKVSDRASIDTIEDGEIASNDFADPLRIYATSLPRSHLS